MYAKGQPPPVHAVLPRPTPGTVPALPFLAHLRAQSITRATGEPHDYAGSDLQRKLARLWQTIPVADRPPLTPTIREVFAATPTTRHLPGDVLGQPQDALGLRCEGPLCHPTSRAAQGKTPPLWRPEFHVFLCNRCRRQYANCRTRRQFQCAHARLHTHPVPDFYATLLQDQATSLEAQSAPVTLTALCGRKRPAVLKRVTSATGAWAMLWLTHLKATNGLHTALAPFHRPGPDRIHPDTCLPGWHPAPDGAGQ